MLEKLQEYCKTKQYLVFDFDRTLAQMEIDWTEWHPGFSAVLAQFDPNHGYAYGKNPHEYGNGMAEKYGKPLITAVNNFNRI